MSLTYFTYVHRLMDLTNTLKTDINPTLMVPACVDYAEQRIYRELNLITQNITDASASLSSDNRTFVLSTAIGTYLTVQEINVINSTSLNSSQGGTRLKLAPAALNVVNFLYPSEKSSFYGSTTANTTFPALFAIKDDKTIIVGPPPDASYFVEIIGQIRPTPLSTANSTTFLSKQLPDLFLAASMVYLCGYAKDKAITTQQSGDIAAATQYWESQYQTLFKSALAEDVRIKYNQTLTAVANPAPTTGGPI